MATEIVYGVHAVGALLERDPAGVLEAWVQANRRHPVLRRALAAAAAHGIAVHEVPRATLDRLAGGARHQGVVVRYRGALPAPEASLETLVAAVGDAPLALVLDEVTDPHNLGACLRSADAAGAAAVVVPRSRSAALTPGARKVAAGAAESVPLVRVSNLASALAALADAGFAVVGAAADGAQSLFDADLRGPLALVLGGEARGLRRLTRERCQRVVRIPMHGRVESLNVSVAAGLLLFEARRQRGG